MNTLQIRTAIIAIAVLIFVIAWQCNNNKVPENTRILELEVEKKLLEAAKDSAVANYTVVAKQRDSALKALKTKPEADKIVIHEKHETIRYKLILLTDSQSVELLAQNLSIENGLPVTIEYQGTSAAVISMNQVDSINFTYDYLVECDEYQDSLESTIVGLGAVVDSGLVAEDHLKTALGKSESMNDINNLIIDEYKKDNKKLRRKLKLYKFGVAILSVSTAILAVIVLVPGA